ncbi:hypothetical protein SLS56_001421 [Neofusicoccum ribis]|uniref:J domain-containing protein n=1 Tax=Neofusicoccum ribis TaxID=45134 RepID=A0ABR3T9Q0_9PEZI
MGSPLPPDPYVALGVAKDATSAVIKTAYRKLALKSHPDKFPDPSQKAEKAAEFHKIQQAYEILGDDDKRERYNAQVRLAELRKEALERQQARGSATKAETRPAAANYETRAPPAAYAARGGSRSYEEPRSRPAYDDDERERVYEEPRPKPRTSKTAYVYSRRTAASPPRRPSTFKIFLGANDRPKARDQDRRRERPEKVVPTYNDSDSDERYRYEERRRRDRQEAQRQAVEEEEERQRNAERFKRQAEADRRRAEEIDRAEREASRRSSSRRPDPADLYEKYLTKEEEAREHISRHAARGAAAPADEPPTRPAATTRSSSKYSQVRPKESSKSSKRSSEKSKDSRILGAFRHGRGTREKERKPTRVAEPEYDEDRRRPPLEKSESSPPVRVAAARGAPERSATMDPFEGRREREEASAQHPRMRRAETMPAQPTKSSHREEVKPNSSKPRTELPRHVVHDSGYSSPSTSASDRETQKPKTKTTQYRYPEANGAAGDDDSDDIYNTVTVEPPSSSGRDSHDTRKPTSRSPGHDRGRGRDAERDSDESGRERPMPSGRTMSSANNTRYQYPAETETRRPHMARAMSSQRVPMTSPVRNRGYERERGRTHVVSPSRDPESGHSHEDRDYERSSGARFFGEIPKHAGEPLRREVPAPVRPMMRRGDSYTRNDVRYAPKINTEDISYASRGRSHRPEQAYVFNNVQLPRPPMTRGNTVY